MLNTIIPFYYISIYFIGLIIIIIRDVNISNRTRILFNSLFIISIFWYAYSFKPPVSFDLYRYFQILERYKNLGWDEIFEYGYYKDTLLTNIYFKLIADTSNYKLFSAIASSGSFMILYRLISKYKNKESVTIQSVALYIIGIISSGSIIGIISGVRQNLGWIFLLIAISYDFTQKKPNKIVVILLYMTAPLIHLGTLPVVLIRIVVIKNNKLSYLIFLWPLAINIIRKYYFLLPDTFKNAFMRLEIYISLQENTFTLNIILKLIIYIILFYLSKSMVKSKVNLKTKKYLNYFNLILIFGLASIFVDYVMFRRISLFLSYLSLPIINYSFKERKTLNILAMYILLVVYIFLFIRYDVIRAITLLK